MTDHFADIDLSFRPPAKLFPLLLSRVKGTARRRELIRAMEEERLEDLPEQFLQSALSHEERSASGALHPALMGGEYLPDFLKDEVEVARIELASTTGDVISIRMRPTKKGLVYRVVDEYMTGSAADDDEDGSDGDGEQEDDDASLVSSKPLVSQVPLSLGELAEFVVEAAQVEEIVTRNEFYTVDDALSFIDGSSVYYPEFGRWMVAYIESVMPENEDEEDECDDEEEDEE